MLEWLKRKIAIVGFTSAKEENVKTLEIGEWIVIIRYNYLDEFINISVRDNNKIAWYHLNVNCKGEYNSSKYDINKYDKKGGN